MKHCVNCDYCDSSKYGGYSDIVNDREYCLLHYEYLESSENGTIPCKQCNGDDFKEDTFAN